MTGKVAKDAHLWERHPEDWYVEERFAVAELFKREAFPGAVWDCCCGRGHILAEALLAGYEATGSDLVDRARVPDAQAAPFVQAPFTDFPFSLGESVIMNPPYLGGEGIEAFVKQAMRYRTVQKIAAFVPGKFLWGADRARDFHTVTPPARVYMITPRPSCPPGPVLEAGISPGGGFEDFAWAVWWRDDDGGWTNERTELCWIVGPDRRKRKKGGTRGPNPDGSWC